MDEFGGGGGGGSPVGALIFLALYLVVMLAFYIFFCFCAKKVCEKCGKDPGILIWIPIVQLIPLMEIAGMQTWMIILAFIPIASIIFSVMLLLGLAKARNKNPVLLFAMAILCLGLPVMPYLAFSE